MLEKCINAFGVDDVIFEESSTGRELFVVLDGEAEIAKISGASKTCIIKLGNFRLNVMYSTSACITLFEPPRWRFRAHH
ncbi:hypothetical protein [Bradyrhizobium sp. CCGB20]|uniref:hypothetical protein n=1 Tax=Bradyrhizobium sp. CCGB20 TaxID=2949633 RepID=UPI0020B39CE6|nr:hypothetical protein [Bradyrhizobium sp. CCGB20]MCP3402942.1 hypothetical protein [Bradyrhizobium sp. CCGB20]